MVKKNNITLVEVLSDWINRQKADMLPRGDEGELVNIITTEIKEYDTDIRNVIKSQVSISNPEYIVPLLKELLPLLISNFEGDSGVVIAGFGEAELYPSANDYSIGIMLPKSRRLLYSLKKQGNASLDNNANLMHFAQGEMVDIFMTGIEPNLKSQIILSFNALLKKYAEHAQSKLGNKTIDQEASGKINELVNDLSNRISNHCHDFYTKPIMDAIAILPKDQLALMAETLVSLTSFKRKMSRDWETVGGAIDVAVITKGDGFVWIKRKHYFDPNLNIRYIEKLKEQAKIKLP